MIRVVIDTSVLVSAVISPTGPNAQLFECIVARKIKPCLTSAVLEEYERVFEYDRLKHLDRRRISLLRTLLENAAVKVKSGGRLQVSIHDDDNRIYECAVAAKADYIITENVRHFRKSHKYTKIINARQLLQILEDGQA